MKKRTCTLKTTVANGLEQRSDHKSSTIKDTLGHLKLKYELFDITGLISLGIQWSIRSDVYRNTSLRGN